MPPNITGAFFKTTDFAQSRSDKAFALPVLNSSRDYLMGTSASLAIAPKMAICYTGRDLNKKTYSQVKAIRRIGNVILNSGRNFQPHVE